MTDKCCDECRHWTTERASIYGDGSRISNWKAPDGKGECSHLNINTAFDFGCNKFDGITSWPTSGNPHVAVTRKNGPPWMHWIMGPCPGCRGRGSENGACHRCAGTGKVRYYDDGYIGEEQTRLHPMEKGNVEPLKCSRCKNVVEVRWVACPICGNRLDGVAETENVGLGNAGVSGQKNDREKNADTLRRDIDKMNERDANLVNLRRIRDAAEPGCSPEDVAAAKSMIDRLEAQGDATAS